jgi:hypothetical protein
MSAVRTEVGETTADLNFSRVRELGHLALHEIGRLTGNMIFRRLRAKYKKGYIAPFTV